jgi:hypothetical protein
LCDECDALWLDNTSVAATSFVDATAYLVAHNLPDNIWSQITIISDDVGRDIGLLPDPEQKHELLVAANQPISTLRVETEGKSLEKHGTWEKTYSILDVPLGSRIALNPAAPQSEDAFTLDSYRKLLERLKQVNEERTRLHQAIQRYSPRERQHSVEWKQYDEASARFRQIVQEYLRRLPLHVMAGCPYCGESIIKPFDHFSLCGFDSILKATRVFHGNLEWRESPASQRVCSHALCSTYAVSLNGVHPDDLTGWLPGKRTERLHGTPHVIVWPLVARHTSAVLTTLAVGRLDDYEPLHHYTVYLMTYFAADDTNLYAREFWVPNDLGGPATGAVWIDFDLIKWVEAERLLWLVPGDIGGLRRGPTDRFPYRNTMPSGWYHLLDNGQIDGPHSYSATWNGKAPHHNESYPNTSED